MNKHSSSYNQCMVSSHMYQDVHFISKTLCSPKNCLFILQFSTPHELSAFAVIHIEHNQLPYVHVHSCTCRCTVLCYTVLPLHTRRLILNTVGLYYFCIIPKLSITSAQSKKKNYSITQYYGAEDLCITRKKGPLYCCCCWYY
jgi:hypothetical protein